MINHALCTTLPEDEPENEVRGLQNLCAPSAGHRAASASLWHWDVMRGNTQIPSHPGAAGLLCPWPCSPTAQEVHSWPSLLLIFPPETPESLFLFKGRWYLQQRAPWDIPWAKPRVKQSTAFKQE